MSELHQGSVLSPFLFVVVMDLLSAEMEGERWEMLFVNDIVIFADTLEEMQRRLLP